MEIEGLTGLVIVPDGDGCAKGERPVKGSLETIAGLAGGMKSGKPSVAIFIRDEDECLIMGETSLALFLSAADALKARHGDPREPGWTPPPPPPGLPKA